MVAASAFFHDQELIDTLWNVNERAGSMGNSGKGINRYIMECKYNAKEAAYKKMLEN